MTSYQRLLATAIVDNASLLSNRLAYLNSDELDGEYLSYETSKLISMSVSNPSYILRLCFGTIETFEYNYRLDPIRDALNKVWLNCIDYDETDSHCKYCCDLIEYLNVLKSMLFLDELWDCRFIDELSNRLNDISLALADLLEDDDLLADDLEMLL